MLLLLWWDRATFTCFSPHPSHSSPELLAPAMEQVIEAGDVILRLEAFLWVVEGLAGNTVSCSEDNLACYARVYKLQFLRSHKAAA